MCDYNSYIDFENLFEDVIKSHFSKYPTKEIYISKYLRESNSKFITPEFDKDLNILYKDYFLKMLKEKFTLSKKLSRFSYDERIEILFFRNTVSLEGYPNVFSFFIDETKDCISNISTELNFKDMWKTHPNSVIESIDFSIDEVTYSSTWECEDVSKSNIAHVNEFIDDQLNNLYSYKTTLIEKLNENSLSKKKSDELIFVLEKIKFLNNKKDEYNNL